MKVLYLGNYKSGTEFGNAAKAYILALHSAGVEVVPRNINISGTEGEIPGIISKLEKQSVKNCDIVIQHMIPSVSDYNGNFNKCIIIYDAHTSHFRRSNWASYINLMDEAWVPSNQIVESSQASDVTIPIRVVPTPCDTEKYNKRYEKYTLPETQNTFIFYTMANFSRRKNVAALLKAFHIEFHPLEPVSLAINIDTKGINSTNKNQYIDNMTLEVKKELKIRDVKNYKPEVILLQNLTELEKMRLHSTCDCYVGPAFGEAWGEDIFDAMAMGKTPICTDIGGPHDFLTMPNNKVAGWLVPGYLTPAFGTSNVEPSNLYVGDEDWVDINIGELRKAMREAYENKNIKQEKSMLGIDNAYNYSYESIGQQMKALLEL